MYSMLKIGSLTCAAIAVAMTGIATHPSLAQQAQAVGFDLFAGGSVDLNPDAATQLVDAARKAQAPGDCPLGRIIIFTAEGDPLFQEALGAARRDAVLGLLNGQGIDPSRFFVEFESVRYRSLALGYQLPPLPRHRTAEAHSDFDAGERKKGEG